VSVGWLRSRNSAEDILFVSLLMAAALVEIEANPRRLPKKAPA
jgi:hypothetical protein